MIIKSMSRTTGSGNVGGLMNYMFREDKVMNLLRYQTREGKFKPCTIKHLLKGDTMKEWASEFESNRMDRKFNRKGAVELYHEVISFANSDSHMIDDTILSDITRQYIKLRSPDAPVVATFHKDTEHVHIHLAIAGSKYLTGMANRMGKFEFRQVKQDMEAYQRDSYPELSNSLVEHGQGRKAEIVRNNIKRQDSIRRNLGNIFSIVSSMEELKQLLGESDISMYQRGGRVYGVTIAGRNYRFSTLGFEEEVRKMEKEQQLLSELDYLREDRHDYRNEMEDEISERLDFLEDVFERSDSEEVSDEIQEENLEMLSDDIHDMNPSPQQRLRKEDLGL